MPLFPKQWLFQRQKEKKPRIQKNRNRLIVQPTSESRMHRKVNCNFCKILGIKIKLNQLSTEEKANQGGQSKQNHNAKY